MPGWHHCAAQGCRTTGLARGAADAAPLLNARVVLPVTPNVPPTVAQLVTNAAGSPHQWSQRGGVDDRIGDAISRGYTVDIKDPATVTLLVAVPRAIWLAVVA